MQDVSSRELRAWLGGMWTMRVGYHEYSIHIEGILFQTFCERLPRSWIYDISTSNTHHIHIKYTSYTHHLHIKYTSSTYHIHFKYTMRLQKLVLDIVSAICALRCTLLILLSFVLDSLGLLMVALFFHQATPCKHARGPVESTNFTPKAHAHSNSTSAIDQQMRTRLCL